jgi:hypothetical protein
MTEDAKTAKILAKLAELGQSVAQMADPLYWGYRDDQRSQPYQQMLPPLRQAYAHIRQGDEPALTLVALRSTIRTGIERNMLERAIDIATGGT